MRILGKIAALFQSKKKSPPATAPVESIRSEPVQEVSNIDPHTHKAFQLRIDNATVATVLLDGSCEFDWNRVDQLASLPLFGLPEHTVSVSIAKLLQSARNKGRTDKIYKSTLPECLLPED